MAVYSIKAIQNIPASLDQVWDFFSNPANLQAITPASLHFNIISKHHDGKMYAGQIIEYKVSPLMSIPLYWMTEITQVVPKQYFIDEQRCGPYSLWHHQHHFKSMDGGVEMTDIIYYKLPLGWLGDAANAIFVRKQLSNIFTFRFQQTAVLFGKWPGQQLILQFN